MLPVLHSSRRSHGFTLIEVLASMAVVVLLMFALTRMFSEAASSVHRGSIAVARNSVMETAMETLLQDLEGMVVNERLRCWKRANVADEKGFGFDDIWFMTTAGDQDDDRAYQAMHYYVTNEVVSNEYGVAYKQFNLVRDMWILAVLDASTTNREPIDALQKPGTYGYKDWTNTAAQADRNVIAENIVRFDIYVLGWDGKSWERRVNNRDVYFSTNEYSVDVPRYSTSENGNKPVVISNSPPAAFDVYMQMTSPETMMKAGLGLMSPDSAIQARAREQMIQDSSSLFGRAVPVTGATMFYEQIHHATNNLPSRYTDP